MQGPCPIGAGAQRLRRHENLAVAQSSGTVASQLGPTVRRMTLDTSASAERAARQELAELSLDEAGEPAAIAAVGDLAQEGFQVLAHDAMEDGALRGPGLIRGDAHGRRASEARAVRGSVRRTALPPWTARRTATWI